MVVSSPESHGLQVQLPTDDFLQFCVPNANFLARESDWPAWDQEANELGLGHELEVEPFLQGTGCG